MNIPLMEVLHCRCLPASQAGLVPALLSTLARRPSQLRYWLAINMGVLGARHLEMQWLMLGEQVHE